jgi:drug/metabolite transporter (DMT)-like permease
MAITAGILFGIIAMFCWGISDFFAAKSVRKNSVIKTLVWSQVIGTAILIISFLFFFRLPMLSLTSLILILIGAFLNTIALLGFYKGLQIGTISVISPISAAYSAITVVLCIVFLNEKLNAQQSIGIILAILGTILVSFKFKDLIRLNLKNISVGVKYGLVAMLGWGIFYVFMKPLVVELGWFLPILLTKMVGLFYLLSYTSIAKKDISFPKNAALLIIGVGIVETMGFLFVGKGMISEKAAIVALVSSVYPIITIFLARVFFKEMLGLNQKIGVAAVLMGLVLLSV